MRYRSARTGKFISEKKWLREREVVEQKINRLGQEMRKAIRARDAARSPKVKAKWQKIIDKARPRQQGELQKRGRLERQGQIIPKGRRVEVSLRFRQTAGWLKDKHRNRLRQLKVIADVRKGVTKAQVERAVEDAMRSGRRTKGIVLRVADWGASREVWVQGQRKVVKSKGRLTGKKLQEQLKPFAGLLRKGAIKSREVRNASPKRAGRGRQKGSGSRRAR